VLLQLAVALQWEEKDVMSVDYEHTIRMLWCGPTARRLKRALSPASASRAEAATSPTDRPVAEAAD